MNQLDTLAVILITIPDSETNPTIYPGMSDHDLVLCNAYVKVKVNRHPTRSNISIHQKVIFMQFRYVNQILGVNDNPVTDNSRITKTFGSYIRSKRKYVLRINVLQSSNGT